MPIYMQYDGIDGDVTAQKHEKWIECHSFQWGVGRGITSPQGRGANREASAPSVSEVVVTKVTEDSSVKLLQASLYGEGKTVKIDFCKTDKDAFEPYLQIELENTLVSGYSISAGGDRPTESLSLNFTKVTFKNIGMGKANETGQPESAFWDLALGTGG